jgi:hypothetical protein
MGGYIMVSATQSGLCGCESRLAIFSLPAVVLLALLPDIGRNTHLGVSWDEDAAL